MNARAETSSASTVAINGERSQRCVAAMNKRAAALVAAVKRSSAFLAKGTTKIALEAVHTASELEVVREIGMPYYRVPFRLEPGGGSGSVLLDVTSIALFFDGVLGGDGSRLPTFPPVLSPAQNAFISGVAASLVESFTTLLSTDFGFRVIPVKSADDLPPVDGVFIACEFSLTMPGGAGTAVLLVSKETLATQLALVEPLKANVMMERIVKDIELELIVELCRMRVPMGQISELQVGDVLTVDTALHSNVSLRTSTVHVAEGQPTVSNGKIAIRIERHGP